MELADIYNEIDPHLDVKRAREGLASFKCLICRDMALLRIHTWPHLTIENIAALEKAASAGCQYCHLLFLACKDYKQECTGVMFTDITVHLQTRVRSIYEERNVLQVKLAFNENQKSGNPIDTRYFEFELYMYEDEHTYHFPKLASRKHISTHPSSKESQNILQSWLGQCNESHEECSWATFDNNNYPELPNRVIDVTTADPKLYLTKGERLPFVALSHCWGSTSKHPVLCTLTSDMEHHQRGISWTSLSKTFQDAIIITRRLGMDYIWIDSLCIIQDDIVDWLREAAKMASVYSGARVVLSALAAENGSIGMLNPYPKILEVNGSFEHPRNTPYRFFTTPSRRDIHDLIETESANFISQKFPLSSRGWVLQERLLARRVVHFSADEMVWECRTGLDCECGGIAKTGTKHEHYVSQKTGVRAQQRLERWYHMVQEFTARNLTKLSDRLPASSGLASQICLPEMGPYIAGLWKHDLLAGLQWRVSREDELTPRTWQPPSWSWSCAPIKVEFDFRRTYDGDVVYQADIVDAACSLTSEEPYGAVNGGQIVLKALCVEAVVCYEVANPEGRYLTKAVIQKDNNSAEIFLEGRAFVGESSVKSGGKVLCLCLETFEFSGPKDDKGRSLTRCLALILRRLVNCGDEPTWERIGVLTLGANEMDSKKKELGHWFENGVEQTVTIV